MTVPSQAIEAYIAFWEDLQQGGLDGIAEVMDEKVRFKDPFNDVTGLSAVRDLLARAAGRFAELSVTVTDRAASEERVYLRWIYRYRLRPGSAPGEIVGMTELSFAPDGRVTAHIDHWDAASQIYERLPLLGPLLRAIRHRIG